MSKDIIENSDLSSSALAAYVGMTILAITDYDSFYTNTRNIYYSLQRKETSESRKLKIIQDGVDELIEKTNLKIKKGYCNGSYICNTDSFRPKVQQGKFMNIDTSEIEKIFSCSFKMKYNLLRYYLFVLSTILRKKEIRISATRKKTNCIGCMYQKMIRDKLNISQSAQITYNEILQKDLKLIYFTEYNLLYHKKDGSFGSAISAYGRYEDREYVEAYVKQKCPHTVEARKKNAVNYHRSMIMKYNEICRGRIYDTNTIWEVADYVTNLNNKSYDLIKNLENSNNPNKKKMIEGEKKKIRDLTVFKNFL